MPASARARGSARRPADAPRDSVGDEEAHAEHARQLVGVLDDLPVRRRPVLGVDPLDEIAEAVRREQQMEAPGDTERLPRLGGLRGALPPQARPHQRLLGVSIDGVEDTGHAVAVDQCLGSLRADVLDSTEIRDDRRLVGRRDGMRLGHLDLEPVATVIDPRADDAGPLALLEVDERTDEHDRLTLRIECVENRPAGLLAGPARPADDHFLIEPDRVHPRHVSRRDSRRRDGDTEMAQSAPGNR